MIPLQKIIYIIYKLSLFDINKLGFLKPNMEFAGNCSILDPSSIPKVCFQGFPIFPIKPLGPNDKFWSSTDRTQIAMQKSYFRKLLTVNNHSFWSK